MNNYMKILLINPPAFNDIGEVTALNPFLGLLYLAAFSEKHGYPNTKIVDADVARLSWQELGNLLVKESPDIVGITATTRFLPALFKTAEIARKKLPNSVIVAGGWGPTVEPEKVLKAANQAVDLVVMKEGEATFLEIIKRTEAGSKDFNGINGLAFLGKNGWLTVTQPRELIMDLDSIPWPAYHLLYPDFSEYCGMHRSLEGMTHPVATMSATRGCPNRCAYCSSGRTLHRSRGPKDIVAEMEFYKNKFQVKSIQLYDDDFIGLTPKQNEWIKEICNEIIKKNLHKTLAFLAWGRCSQFIELETLKKMKEANFVWIRWGVESGSQKVLDVIKKDIQVPNIIRAFALAREAGIKSAAYIMIGLPGETPADIKMTSDLIKKIKADRVSIHPLTPWPGTEMTRYLKENNLLDELTPDYYKLDMRKNIIHHTNEMTRDEIMKYYRLMIFRFESNYRNFIKFGVKSLTTIDGWKKLFKRIKIIINYFLGWSKL